MTLLGPRRRPPLRTTLLCLALAALPLTACDSNAVDQDMGTDTGTDSGRDQSSTDTGPDTGTDTGPDVALDAGPDGTPDQTTDVVTDVPGDVPPDVISLATPVAAFDPQAFQYAEGIARKAGDASSYVGFAPTGTIVKVADADGTVTPFSQLPFVANGGNFLLGLAFDPAGENLYAGVSAGTGTGAPAAGVYKIPVATGTAPATPFASNAGLTFPNATVFDAAGVFAYVTDSASGAIFRVTAAVGTTEPWITDPLLAGDATTCNLALPFPVGANGMALVDSSLYVANTQKGSIVEVPIEVAGTAGQPVNLLSDCATLGGIDGLIADADGGLLAVNNGLNTVLGVTLDPAASTVLDQGPAYDAPASLALDDTGNVLYVTNFAIGGLFGTNPDPRPGLVRLQLE